MVGRFKSEKGLEFDSFMAQNIEKRYRGSRLHQLWKMEGEQACLFFQPAPACCFLIVFRFNQSVPNLPSTSTIKIKKYEKYP